MSFHDSAGELRMSEEHMTVTQKKVVLGGAAGCLAQFCIDTGANPSSLRVEQQTAIFTEEYLVRSAVEI